jgi:hypothetical protein
MADRDICAYLSVILLVVIRDVSMQIINQGFLSCCCFNQSEGLTRL